MSDLDKDIEIVEEIVIQSRDLREEEFYKLIGIKQIQAIVNVLADRETWKKIAEKLAEDKIIPKCKNCSDEDTLECTECVLEWARKEVDKDVVREYVYLISYHHSKGCGTITINLNGEINSVEHIAEIHKYIENKNKFENVGIISYQLICKNWVRKEVENEENNSNN